MPPDVANNLKMAVLQQDRAELQNTIDLLRQDLAARNDVEEELAELVKEKNILEDLVVSTQAENERCEAELKKWKAYAKELEKKIAVYEGPNWQEESGLPATPATIKALRPFEVSKFLVRVRPDQSPSQPPTQPMERRPRRMAVRAPYIPPVSDSEDSGPEASEAKQEQIGSGVSIAPGRITRPRIHLVRGLPRHAVWDSTFARPDNLEEQVVPALANAEKKQERRMSLLASSRMGIRNPSPEPEKSDDPLEELEVITSPESKQPKLEPFSAGSDVESADNDVRRPSSSTADRIETLLTQFELETGTVLTTFRQMIRRTEQDENERKASKRKQQDDRAEALQQISDMADDVKQHMDSLEAEAEEREMRLTEMLKTVLATAESYDPTKSDEHLTRRRR